MAEVYKIVVTGPFDSGKTTFIGSISEIDVVSTERTTRVGGKRHSTTVAMDFGRITLREGRVLFLYGTPGQGRFDFMWEILSEGMLGYVLLLDGSRPDTFEEGLRILDAFERISEAPHVVALTRPEAPGSLHASNAARRVPALKGHTVCECDARSLKDVKDVLLELLEAVLARAEARAQAG